MLYKGYPDMNATKGLVFISESMIRAGVEALEEESYSTPHSDLVDLIYSAMEYQRRREEASLTSE